MLVLSRQTSTWTLLYNKQTKELLGKVATMPMPNKRGRNTRIGFHFAEDVGITRQELTQFKEYTFEQMLGVALGTILEFIKCKKSLDLQSQGSTPICRQS